MPLPRHERPKSRRLKIPPKPKIRPSRTTTKIVGIKQQQPRGARTAGGCAPCVDGLLKGVANAYGIVEKYMTKALAEANPAQKREIEEFRKKLPPIPDLQPLIQKTFVLGQKNAVGNSGNDSSEAVQGPTTTDTSEPEQGGVP